MLVSLPLAEANDSGQFGVSGGVPSTVFYVEDRPMGPNKRPGSLLVGNMRAVFSTTGNSKARMAMCELIATEFFPRPVFAARWPAVRDAAERRATENNTTPEQEVVNATIQAIGLILPSEIVTSPEMSFERVVAQLINNHVTEDFLGPDWRRRYGTKDVPAREIPYSNTLNYPGESVEDDVLATQFGRELIARAKLSPNEASVLGATVAGYTAEEWATARGVEASGARTSLSRARKKIARAMG